MRISSVLTVGVCFGAAVVGRVCFAVSDVPSAPAAPEEVRVDAESRAQAELGAILIQARYYAASGQVEKAKETYLEAIEKYSDCAHAYYQLANLLLGADDLDPRIKYLEKAIELDPGMEAAYVSLGISYKIKKQTEKTIATYKKAIEKVEDDLPFFWSLASAYLDLGNAKEAEETLRESCERHPDSSQSWFRLIEFLVSRRRIEEADEVFEQGLKATNNSLTLLREVRGLYLRWKKYEDKAVAILERTLALYPESPSMWLQLVQHYLSRGEKEKAAEATRTAIQPLRYDEKFFTSLSAVYINARDWDSAIFVLREAAKYHGASVDIWRTLASLYNQTGETVKARECYQKILSMEPGRVQEQRLLAHSYLAEKNFEKAIEEFQEAVRNFPKDLRLKVDLANAYLAQGEIEKGEGVFLDLIKERPDKSEIYLLLASYYLKTEKLDQMREVIGKAVGLEKEDPAKQARIFLLMGQAALETEKVSVALGLLREAVEKDPDNASHAFALARAYLLVPDKEKAAEHLHKAAEMAKPANADWYLMLGETYRALGKKNQAAESFGKAIVILEGDCEKSPKNWRVWYRLGQAYERTDDVVKAARAFGKCVDLEAESGDLKYKLATVYSDLRWHEKAQEQLEEAATLPSAKPEWFLSLGEVQRTLAKRTEAALAFEKAISLLREARDREPEDFKVWAALGEAHSRAGQKREAVEALNKALQLAGEKADYRLQVALARAYENSGQTEAAREPYLKAAAFLQEAVKNNPKDGESYLRLGLILVNLRDFSGSAEALSMGIELAGGDASYSSYVALADVLEKNAQPDESKAQFQKAHSILTERIKEHPEDVSAYYMLANVCEKLGDLEECERQYKKVMELDPYFAAAYNNLGYTWIENDMNIEQAMEYVRKALELEPESGAYIDSLGWGYFKQGKLDEALAELFRALKFETTDPTVFDHIGDVYKAKSMIREAIEYWQKALEMNPNDREIREKIKERGGTLPQPEKKNEGEGS